MTMSRTVSPDVKWCSMCGVTGMIASSQVDGYP
jgi:hypothetical protein